MENPFHGIGPVPIVDPTDVKNVWQLKRDVGAHQGPVAIGWGLVERACSPGANAKAVVFRATMVALLWNIFEATAKTECDAQKAAERMLALINKDDERVFKTVAAIPCRWFQDSGPQTIPLDVEDFVRQVDTPPAGR